MTPPVVTIYQSHRYLWPHWEDGKFTWWHRYATRVRMIADLALYPDNKFYKYSMEQVSYAEMNADQVAKLLNPELRIYTMPSGMPLSPNTALMHAIRIGILN